MKTQSQLRLDTKRFYGPPGGFTSGNVGPCAPVSFEAGHPSVQSESLVPLDDVLDAIQKVQMKGLCTSARGTLAKLQAEAGVAAQRKADAAKAAKQKKLNAAKVLQQASVQADADADALQSDARDKRALAVAHRKAAQQLRSNA